MLFLFLAQQNMHRFKSIFEHLAIAYPNPRSSLAHQSPFQLLIAVLLSAQATDVSVNKVTEHLFKIAPTPEKMLLLGENELKKQIHSIGLYNIKAANIIKLCHILIDQHASKVPQDRVALEALPGVGRKTANVVLNAAFGQPTLAVDTHVFRVANRIEKNMGKTPKEVEERLIKVIPKKFLPIAHYLLIIHGRQICKARHPLCEICCIRQWCDYGIISQEVELNKPQESA